MEDNEARKAYCSKCGGERTCHVVAKYEQKGGDDDLQWQTDWRTLKCGGCENVFVQRISTNSEDYSHHELPDGDFEIHYDEEVSYWPPILRRKPPHWISEHSLSPDENSLQYNALKEVYGALNNDLPMSAAIAIRTSFDIAAVRLGADESASFESKIDYLVKSGTVGPRDRELLAQLVNAGGASAHRGWIPNQGQLDDLVDILEHFVESVFVAPKRREKLEAKAKVLETAVPPRKRKR